MARRAANRLYIWPQAREGQWPDCAIILAMIAVLIGYAAASRFFAPVPIHFAESISIACLGLAVNVASALILSSGGHHHHHGRDHEYPHRPRRKPRPR